MKCRQARHLSLVMAALGALWLGVFPLWQDLSYAHITRAKWIGALCLCALCVITAVPVAIVALRRERRRGFLPHPALWLALGYFLWVALSAWQGNLSGQLNGRGESAVLMGAIRYEGLYTHLCYGLIFLSMSVYPARLRPVLRSAAAALALFIGLVALQYTGVNPLGLYPSGRSIYANYEFQGTIGNIDMVSGYLCLVMPLLLMGYLLKGGPALLAGGLGCVLLMSMIEVQSGLIATALLCGLLLAAMLCRTDTRCRGLVIFCGMAAMLALRKAVYLPWLDGGLRTEAPVTFSFGRTSAMLLGMSGVLGCAALLVRAHPGLALSGRAVLALIAVFVIAVVSVLAFAPIPESMGGVYEIHEMLCGRARDEYGSWRVGAWRNALAIWKENPIFGTGPDTYYYALHNRLEATGEVLGENFDNPHNEYLAILSNNGLPALLFYLGLLFTVLLSCLRLGRQEGWLWALGASILCYAAQGFFSFSICLVSPMFWAVLGMTCAHMAVKSDCNPLPGMLQWTHEVTHMLTNYELKLRARTALKDNWPIALMVALIAALPSLIYQVLSVLAMNSDGAANAFNQLLSAINISYVNMSKLEGALETLSGIFMPTLVVMLISSLITPALTLGQLNYGMKLLRGDEDALIGTVFSRMNRFLKALGLILMIYLRTALWMLPGLALEILAGVVLGLGGADLTWLFFILCYGGMIAMMVLGIRAALHYNMATFAMAEEPSRGINQCIRLSVSIMRRRKLLLFSLKLSFIGYFLVLALVNTLLSALLGNVLGSTVYMALSMALNVYVMVAECAFYQAYRDQPL